MFTVYVIKNDVSGKTYTGETENIDLRLQRHNGYLKTKNTSYTYKNKGKWKVVYQEKYNTREEAIRREKQLKSYQGRQYVKRFLGP